MKTLASLPIVLIMFMFIGLFPPASTVWAQSEPLGLFSDPAEQAPVPEGWSNKPLKYNEADADADIVLSLDQHLYPMLLGPINDYARRNSLKIAVTEGTCGISNSKLLKKEVDIAGFCCPPSKLDRFPGLRFHTLAVTALALMVHPDNPLNGVTLPEARDIYAGKILRWSELKSFPSALGKEGRILPVTRLHCKLRPGDWRTILPSESDFGAGVTDVAAIADMMALVSSDKNSFGYEVAWNALYPYRDKGEVKFLKIDGISPFDREALALGRYPFYRVYNVTTWVGEGVASKKADDLVSFLRSEVVNIDASFGAVPWTRLKEAGWKFEGNEIVGVPKK